MNIYEITKLKLFKITTHHAARFVVPVWIWFAIKELGPRGRVNFSPERGILRYRALCGFAFRDFFRVYLRMFRIAIGALLRVFLTCRILRVKHTGLKWIVVYGTWSIFDKWNLSVNCLVVRTEFCYDEFTVWFPFLGGTIIVCVIVTWRFKTNSGLPFSHQVIGAVVAQLFWFCMKAVLSFIAKDVVAKGLDHDTFVLSIRSSRLESSLKGML